MASASSIWVSPQPRVDLLVEGKSAPDQSRALRSFISQRAGDEAADLFAEPKSGPQGSRLWADRRGATETLALSDLPEAERRPVEEKLRTRLAEIEPLQGDPRYGALVSAALTIEDASAIRVAGGRPILAGWGGMPPGLATADDMRRHHARTIGPYLPFTDPPIPTADNRGVAAGPARVARISPGWLAAAIAVAAAGIALLLLMIPGVLTRGAPSLAATIPPGVTDAEDVNRQLEMEITARERQLGRNICTIESRSISPRIEERPLTAPPPSGATPPPQPERRSELTPPVRPDRTPVPPQSTPSQSERPETLAKLMNAVTVLVVTKTGFGTGFFISPQLILTNRHVVENDGGLLLAGNHTLAQMHPVERLAVTANSNLGEPDYALLKLKDGASKVFLSISQDIPEQLQNVFAAGYPGFVVRTDANFNIDRLRAGEASSIPDMALTNGTVVVVQYRDTPTPVILHHASISPGNSGGPLIDECGRVVGVNTFVAPPKDVSDRMNYSLATTSAVNFLRGHGVNPSIMAGRCIVAAEGVATNPEQKPGESPPAVGGDGPPKPAPNPVTKP